MNVEQVMERTLIQVEGFMGNKTFIWKGESYPFIIGSILDNIDPLGMGGFPANSDLVIKARKTLFPSGVYPKEKQIITIDGRNFRIDKIHYEPFGVFIRFFCTNTTKGA